MPISSEPAIPEAWIQSYVDQLLAFAAKLSPREPMHAAALLRVEHAMDLVEAWRKRNDKHNP